VGRELASRQLAGFVLREIRPGSGIGHTACADLQVEAAPDAPDVSCLRQCPCHALLSPQITCEEPTEAWLFGPFLKSLDRALGRVVSLREGIAAGSAVQIHDRADTQAVSWEAGGTVRSAGTQSALAK
jgi:hypothetical protein